MYNIFYGTYSIAPTSSDYIELFMFNFCLLDLQWVTPNPMDISPPVWLFISWYTAPDAFTHVNILCIVVASNPLFSLRVQWKNLSILPNFPQFSTLLFDTLFVNKLTAVSKLGLDLFIINNKFSTTEWDSYPLL